MRRSTRQRAVRRLANHWRTNASANHRRPSCRIYGLQIHGCHGNQRVAMATSTSSQQLLQQATIQKKNTKIVRLSVIDIIQQSEAENDAECKRRKRTMNRCVKWLRSLNENYYNHRFNPLADTACQTVCYLCLVILCAKTIYPLQRSLVHGLSPDIAQNFPDVIHHPRCWYKLVVSLYSRTRNYWISFSTRCQICYCNQRQQL